jgi:hypothetical protein
LETEERKQAQLDTSMSEAWMVIDGEAFDEDGNPMLSNNKKVLEEEEEEEDIMLIRFLLSEFIFSSYRYRILQLE